MICTPRGVSAIAAHLSAIFVRRTLRLLYGWLSNEPTKPLAIRLNAKADPVAAVFVPVIRQSLI